MSEITRVLIARVGVDLAKRVIQVHAVDATGRRVVARSLKRDQFLAWCAQLPRGCLVAMEACSSAHHWARKLRALGLDARLIAAHFVSPYRMEGKSGKNDMGHKSPQALGGTPVSLLFYVPDVDAVFARALAAGGKQVKPLQNQFYGDRSGTLTDPFGHVWTVATHVEDVAPDEMDRRMKKAMQESSPA